MTPSVLNVTNYNAKRKITKLIRQSINIFFDTLKFVNPINQPFYPNKLMAITSKIRYEVK